MRIGIYGGSFNPPHIGHYRAASAFASRLKLDRLLIIPTAIPPHKKLSGSISCEKRLELSRLAFSDIPSAEVSDMEIKRGGTSYTYLTVEELYNPSDELFLLVGTDMLLSFDTWHRFEDIFKLSTVAVVMREDSEAVSRQIDSKIAQFSEKYGARIVRISVEPTEISSTAIRESIKRGIVPKEFLVDKTVEIIESEGLYR